jgi:hypothetical protein
MGRSPPPPRGTSVRVLLETATQLFRATVLKCLPLGMLAVLAGMVPLIYWRAAGHPFSMLAEHDMTYDLLTLLGTALELWLLGALLLRQRALVTGAPIGIRDELFTSLRRLPILFLCWIVAVASVVLGLLLAVVPGLFLWVCYLVLLPVVLFDGVGPYTALARCVLLVRAHWWQYFAAFVIALCILLVCALVLSAFISLIEGLLFDSGPVFEAIWVASSIGVGALVVAFLCGLSLVLHSAASNSA